MCLKGSHKIDFSRVMSAVGSLARYGPSHGLQAFNQLLKITSFLVQSDCLPSNLTGTCTHDAHDSKCTIFSPFILITRRTLCKISSGEPKKKLEYSSGPLDLQSAFSFSLWKWKLQHIRHMRGQGQQKKKLVKGEPLPAKSCRNPSSSL